MELFQAFPIAIIDEDMQASMPPAAACGSLPQRSKSRVSAWSAASATRTPGGWSKSSTTSPAGWFPSTARRTADDAGRSSKRCLPQSAARTEPADLPVRRQTTAEMVPAAVLRHANAFMRLFEDSPEFLARAIVRAARNYLERLPPPMFKALMEYTLQASYSWHTPGHGGGVAFRKSPVGTALLRSSSARTRCAPTSRCRWASSARCSTTPDPSPRASAMPRGFSARTKRCSSSAAHRRPTRSSGTAWSSRGDLVLCDRNCHKSILHSLIMTGATPIYLMPSRNGLGIIGPISKDQFTPESIKKKIAASPFAKETSGKVRLMVITNSTYDGLCYNIDAIKESIGDAVEVLHFDEAWYAYANFHEFYDGYHGISSAHPARSPNAITFATHSTHKLLAALVAGVDDPRPARREEAAGHGALQRRVHDAHLDLAAIRHHRLLRRRRGDDGAARRAARSCRRPSTRR